MITILNTSIAAVTKKQIGTYTHPDGFTGVDYLEDLLDKYNRVEYAGFIIRTAESYTRHKYTHTHKDYDGPEDKRLGYCQTIEDCIAQINEKNMEDEPEAKIILSDSDKLKIAVQCIEANMQEFEYRAEWHERNGFANPDPSAKAVFQHHVQLCANAIKAIRE